VLATAALRASEPDASALLGVSERDLRRRRSTAAISSSAGIRA